MNHFHNDIGEEIEVLFKGEWNADQVSFGEVSSTREIDEELETLALDSWHKMLNEAKTEGSKLWDSVTYRYEHHIVGENLSLSVSTIPFSVRFGMNNHTKLVCDKELRYAPQGMYATCLVRTSDGEYIFIEKSKKYYTKKRYAFVGGVLSKSEAEIKDGEGLFKVVETEVSEELGIGRESISHTVLQAGYRSENRNICLLFSVDLTLTKEQINESFHRTADGEAKQLHFLSASVVRSFKGFEPKDKIKFEVLGMP